MDRRGFISLGVAGGVAAVLAPTLAMAKATIPTSEFAGGVFYTAANPGRWSKKVSGHLPVIELGKDQIQVITGHEMKGYTHYITKHTLLDRNFKFLAEKRFDPTKDMQAKSIFTTKNYSGKIYVLSHCNKHDTWLNVVEI